MGFFDGLSNIGSDIFSGIGNIGAGISNSISGLGGDSLGKTEYTGTLKDGTVGSSFDTGAFKPNGITGVTGDLSGNGVKQTFSAGMDKPIDIGSNGGLGGLSGGELLNAGANIYGMYMQKDIADKNFKLQKTSFNNQAKAYNDNNTAKKNLAKSEYKGTGKDVREKNRADYV
jgi:hypothetical protein